MSPRIQRRGLIDFTTVARAGWCTAFALALASACGGQSFRDNGGEAGETNSGGATSVAGSSSGGKAHAGSSNHAGSSSTAGSGTAGAPPFMSACAGPYDNTAANGASCTAYFPRWTHDINTGVCTPVVYGGCGATKNNYETPEACQKACPGGSPNYDACKVAADCVLGATGCCGVCDGPNVSKHDFLAYNKANIDEVDPCGNLEVACGACPNPETSQKTRQFFVPNCVAGECVVEDLRESEVTACNEAADCKLRSGTACCEGCGGGDVVAVRADGSFEKLVCAGADQGCPNCAPLLPTDASANCGLNGHCEVVYLLK